MSRNTVVSDCKSTTITGKVSLQVEVWTQNS